MSQGNDAPRSPGIAETIWPLVTGLAVGFLVGRETAGRAPGNASSGDSAIENTADKVPEGTQLPAKGHKARHEFPEGWTKSADLTSVTSVSFDGLTPSQ